MKNMSTNTQIQNAVNFYNFIETLDQEALANAPFTFSDEQNGFIILLGYLKSLAEVAEIQEVALDLDWSYKTVKNMMPAIGYEFVVGMNSKYSTAENIVIAEKTIAAYLTFLAANEHNIPIKIEMNKSLTKEALYSSGKWAGYNIWLEDDNKSVDFLSAITGCAEYKNHVLRINMEKAMDMYKELTGVDLETLQVDSVEFHLG